MKRIIKVNEIFKSIQGETSYAGLPCVFIRLTGCNLRCCYCDTTYAYEEGTEKSIIDIIEDIVKYSCNLVMVTGGEPLHQSVSKTLIDRLIENGKTVLVETNGSISIRDVNKKAVIIMDIKCPSSGMSEKMAWENLDFLKNKDEVNFVIGDCEDYNWARNKIDEYSLLKICTVLFAPIHDQIHPKKLANWILADNLNVRLNLQLHKYIWNTSDRSV